MAGLKRLLEAGGAKVCMTGTKYDVTCIMYMLGAKHGFGQSMDGTVRIHVMYNRLYS